nr:3-hydroxyacyl-CoA dehydrogenase NAD-binding domain-containing protein [Geobacillus sp. JS12]
MADTIAVIGAGVMGSGIAQTAAMAGKTTRGRKWCVKR